MQESKKSAIYNKKNRLNRSELAVPAVRHEFFEKAAKSKADAIFLDLEDSISVDQKDKARKLAVEAINDVDWGKKIISVRTNAYDTSFFEEDLEFILRKSSERLDLLMIPKCEKAENIVEIDKLTAVTESKLKRKKKIGFELIIETALGLINIEKIAASCVRNETLHFGSADLASSLRAKMTSIGGINRKYGVLEDNDDDSKRHFYLNDMWHSALFKIILTARAFDLRAIDCPYGNFNDKEGFFALAKKSYSMGFDGKMLIHPNQIEWANVIYAPTALEIEEANNILEAMSRAKKKGKGAIAFNGKLLDIVSIKQANNILDMAKQISNKDKD